MNQDLWGVDVSNQVKYFCSYEYYNQVDKQVSGCTTMMIGVDVEDELYEAKEAVAAEFNLKVEGLVFISFNKL